MPHTVLSELYRVHLKHLQLPEEHPQRHNATLKSFKGSTGKCAAMHVLGLESVGHPGSPWIT